MIEIVRLDAASAQQASRFTAKIFPYLFHQVYLSFWCYPCMDSTLAKKMLRVVGISSITDFWAAVDENGEIRGVIGLYSYIKDEDEAAWVSWFCVDPKARRQGIGQRLLGHAVEQARARGMKYVRLYTSTLANEAAAQFLYEKNGLRLCKEYNLLLYKKLYRELKL